MTWHEVLVVALAAGLGSLLATPAMAWIARRVGMLDRPGGYKAHARAVPLLGGGGIAVGLLAGVFAIPRWEPATMAGMAAIGVGGLIVVAAGLLDDTRILSVRSKLAWQLAAAAAAGACLALLGARVDLALRWPPAPVLLLTVLWVVGVTNAVNFLDNMNGLCAGLGAVAAGALAAANLRAGDAPVAVLAAALAGACVGFLPYNFPQARVFLGDMGSMLIGFLLAALSAMGAYARDADGLAVSVGTSLLVLAIPILDGALVVILRLRDGQPPWIGDRRHVSHRLVRRGMHPAAAVAALWAAGAVCGLAALLLPSAGIAGTALLLALVGCALGALAGTAGTRGLP